MPELLEKRVLRAMTEGLNSVVGLHVALGVSEAEVHRVVNMLAVGGLVQRPDPDNPDMLALTPEGRHAAVSPTSFVFAKSVRGSQPVDAADLGIMISTAWTMSRQSRQQSRQQSRAHQQERLLASDEEREAVVRAVSDAYSTGRLSLEELNERTGAALQARTRGDLARVTLGLGDIEMSGSDAGRRRLSPFAFTMIAVLSVPLLALGLLLVAQGEQPGLFLGLALLLLLVPALAWAGWRAFRPQGPERA